jgi:hypothetical protein
MSFGITAAEAGLAIAAVGAAVSGYSAIQNSEAQAAAAKYQAQVASNNQQIASMNANQAVEQGNQQLQAEQQQAAQRQGTIRAVMGASGIDLNSGSALRDQQGVAEVDTLNEQTITSNAARSAWNYKNQGADYGATAALGEMQAQSAQSAGLMSGFSSLLSGAGSFASGYQKLYPSAPASSPTG